MKIRFITCLIFLTALISVIGGCEKPANLNSKFDVQKQVVNCLFANGENFYVYTSLTATPIDSNLVATDSNSIVILSENGVFKEIIPYQKFNSVYKSSTIARAGVDYKLQVRNPKFADNRYQVDAVAKLPDSITILNAYFKDSAKQDAGGNWLGKIHFEISDKSGMVNPEFFIEYYDAQRAQYASILSFIPDNNWKKYASASITNSTYSINNSDWKGATIGFDLYVASIDYNILGLTQFRLSLSNLSNDWRTYQNSLVAYIKAGGADQLQVYSNIIGEGYGIFAGKYISQIIIK